MNDDQRKLARHALGLDRQRRSYRNKYVVYGPGPGMESWESMVATGEAEREQDGRMTVYSLSLAGARLALKPGETLDLEDFPNAR